MSHWLFIPTVAMLLVPTLTVDVRAQLTWQQQMDEFSAVLPLTLDHNVYRIRCKPPAGVAPQQIHCDIGITGTVLTDQRGTSVSDSGEKVVGGLLEHDDIDVYFTDRVFTGHHTLAGDRIIRKYDFDCGINIKYENKNKVSQVEIRVGYVLPSGDIEGLTWAKLRRKVRIYQQNLAKCTRYKRDIVNLRREQQMLARTPIEHQVQQTRIQARLSGIGRQITRLDRFASREEEFKRDLAAFVSLDEYLKTKVNGSQVFVHFHYNGETLPVDIDELQRSRIRPIQVFEEGKNPIKEAAAGL